MRHRYSLVLAVLAINLGTTFQLRAGEKPSPSQPFTTATESLEKGKFSEAQRWFGITYRDFPKSEEGRKSLIHETLLTVSEELSNLKLSQLWKEAAELSQVESGLSKPQRQRSQEHEKRASAASENLIRLARSLLNEESIAVPMSFRVDLSNWTIDDLRARVRKGENLEPKDAERLERGEFIAAYVNLVSVALNLPEDVLTNGSYEGTGDSAAIYKIVGTRLFIANQHRPETERRRLTTDCFERILKLTTETPYDKQRLEALDFLAKLATRPTDGALPAPTCPLCKRTMELDWKICPYDGTQIEPKK